MYSAFTSCAKTKHGSRFFSLNFVIYERTRSFCKAMSGLTPKVETKFDTKSCTLQALCKIYLNVG